MAEPIFFDVEFKTGPFLIDLEPACRSDTGNIGAAISRFRRNKHGRKGPAERCTGLGVGDVLVSVNGQYVAEMGTSELEGSLVDPAYSFNTRFPLKFRFVRVLDGTSIDTVEDLRAVCGRTVEGEPEPALRDSVHERRGAHGGGGDMDPDMLTSMAEEAQRSFKLKSTGIFKDALLEAEALKARAIAEAEAEAKVVSAAQANASAGATSEVGARAHTNAETPTATETEGQTIATASDSADNNVETSLTAVPTDDSSSSGHSSSEGRANASASAGGGADGNSLALRRRLAQDQDGVFRRFRPGGVSRPQPQPQLQRQPLPTLEPGRNDLASANPSPSLPPQTQPPTQPQPQPQPQPRPRPQGLRVKFSDIETAVEAGALADKKGGEIDAAGADTQSRSRAQASFLSPPGSPPQGPVKSSLRATSSVIQRLSFAETVNSFTTNLRRVRYVPQAPPASGSSLPPSHTAEAKLRQQRRERRQALNALLALIASRDDVLVSSAATSLNSLLREASAHNDRALSKARAQLGGSGSGSGCGDGDSSPSERPAPPCAKQEAEVAALARQSRHWRAEPRWAIKQAAASLLCTACAHVLHTRGPRPTAVKATKQHGSDEDGSRDEHKEEDDDEDDDDEDEVRYGDVGESRERHSLQCAIGLLCAMRTLLKEPSGRAVASLGDAPTFSSMVEAHDEGADNGTQSGRSSAESESLRLRHIGFVVRLLERLLLGFELYLAAGAQSSRTANAGASGTGGDTERRTTSTNDELLALYAEGVHAALLVLIVLVVERSGRLCLLQVGVIPSLFRIGCGCGCGVGDSLVCAVGDTAFELVQSASMVMAGLAHFEDLPQSDLHMRRRMAAPHARAPDDGGGQVRKSMPLFDASDSLLEDAGMKLERASSMGRDACFSMQWKDDWAVARQREMTDALARHKKLLKRLLLARAPPDCIVRVALAASGCTGVVRSLLAFMANSIKVRGIISGSGGGSGGGGSDDDVLLQSDMVVTQHVMLLLERLAELLQLRRLLFEFGATELVVSVLHRSREQTALTGSLLCIARLAEDDGSMVGGVSKAMLKSGACTAIAVTMRRVMRRVKSRAQQHQEGAQRVDITAGEKLMLEQGTKAFAKLAENKNCRCSFVRPPPVIPDVDAADLDQPPLCCITPILRHVHEPQVVRNCLYSLMLVAKQREVRIAIVQFGLVPVIVSLIEQRLANAEAEAEAEAKVEAEAKAEASARAVIAHAVMARAEVPPTAVGEDGVAARRQARLAAAMSCEEMRLAAVTLAWVVKVRTRVEEVTEAGAARACASLCEFSTDTPTQVHAALAIGRLASLPSNRQALMQSGVRFALLALVRRPGVEDVALSNANWALGELPETAIDFGGGEAAAIAASSSSAVQRAKQNAMGGSKSTASVRHEVAQIQRDKNKMKQRGVGEALMLPTLR